MPSHAPLPRLATRPPHLAHLTAAAARPTHPRAACVPGVPPGAGAAHNVVALWDTLLAQPEVEAVGLGARDSLRLEARLLPISPLYLPYISPISPLYLPCSVSGRASHPNPSPKPSPQP